jgi:molybdopterin converting factor small subunit
MPTSDASSSSQDDPRSPVGPGPEAVTFRMFAAARAAAGTSEVHVAAGPTAEVVTALAAALPPRFADVMAASSLVADGHRLDHASPAPIAGGTIVDVLPPFAGG